MNLASEGQILLRNSLGDLKTFHRIKQRAKLISDRPNVTITQAGLARSQETINGASFPEELALAADRRRSAFISG
jgi:hypothetical protein